MKTSVDDTARGLHGREDSRPGPVAEKLLNLLRNDMTPTSETLTKVFE